MKNPITSTIVPFSTSAEASSVGELDAFTINQRREAEKVAEKLAAYAAVQQAADDARAEVARLEMTLTIADAYVMAFPTTGAAKLALDEHRAAEAQACNGSKPDCARIKSLAERIQAGVTAFNDSLERLASNSANLEKAEQALRAYEQNPEAFSAEQMPTLGAYSLQVNALPKVIARQRAECSSLAVRLVPLVTHLEWRMCLALSVLRRARAEMSARQSQHSCKLEARIHSWSTCPSSLAARERSNTLASPYAARPKTFSELAERALSRQDEALKIVTELEELTENLGGIPTRNEFEGRLCPCGCGNVVDQASVRGFLQGFIL